MPVNSVYSSSSVTELVDIVDAGSGNIITDEERASILKMSAILEHSRGIPKLSSAAGLLVDRSVIKNLVMISHAGGPPMLYENDLVANFVYPIIGTWKLNKILGTTGVGPTKGSLGWWRNDSIWPFNYDDEFIFHKDGTFTNNMGSNTLSITDKSLPPVYPHDGSKVAKFTMGVDDNKNNTVTLIGKGAFLGIPKINNGLQLTDSNNAPDFITYIILDESATKMTLSIEGKSIDNTTNQQISNWWTFSFVK